MRYDYRELRGLFPTLRAGRLAGVMARLRGCLAALVLTVVASAGAMGQELQVVSFEETMEVMYSDMQVRDLNDEVCALVRVELPMEGAVFQGGIVSQSFVVNQYYVYMPQGEKLLRILCPGRQTLDVDMGSMLGSGLRSSRIYKLVLSGYPANAEEIEGSNPDMTFKEAWDLYNEAHQLLDNAEHFKALEALFKAAEYTGNDNNKDKLGVFYSLVFDLIGVCYYELGDYQKSIEYETKAVNQHPNNQQALHNLIYTFHEMGNYNAAMNNIDRYIITFVERKTNSPISYEGSIDKYNSEVYSLKGDIHKQKGEYKNAEESFLKSLAYEENSFSHLRLADVYKETGRYAEAIEHYKEGIAYEPNRFSNVKRYLDLAEAYYYNNQNDECIKSCNECVKSAINQIDIIYSMTQPGEEEKANEAISELGFYASRATLWIARLSDPSPENIERYLSVIDLEGIGVEARDILNIFGAYALLDDKEGAHEIMTKGFEKFPDNLEIKAFYAIDILNDSVPEKITLLKEIIERERTYTPIIFKYSVVYGSLINSCMIQNRISEGLTYAETAVAKWPDRDALWLMLGEIYEIVNRYEDSIEALTKCIAIENGVFKSLALNIRSRVYMELGETEKANRDLEEAKKYEQ